MNNLNEIIDKSLGLINYNRSKHITEQVIPKKMETPFSLDIGKLKSKYLSDKDDSPFLTLKSVVKNQDIYIPLIKVKTKTPETDFLKGLQPKYGKIDTLFPKDLKSFYYEKTTYEKPKIVKTVNGIEPFNRQLAEQYFGSQCMKLSGKHPTYNVGYSKELDYFIDDSGRRCVPIPYKTTESSVSDIKTKKTKISVVETYQLDLPKSVKLKNGNTIQKSKFKYEKSCKNLTYDECLKVSWDNLFSFNTQNQGVYEIEIETQSSVEPSVNSKTNKKTYIGCISDEWFPWYNYFVGYIEKSQYKVLTDSAGIKQGTKCLSKNVTNSGVNKMESYLGNLSSKVTTLDLKTGNSVENFPMDSALMKSIGKDYRINTKYYDYTVDLNQWFTFGEKDYYKGYAGIDKTLTDYINTQNNELNINDSYLKNFYGFTSSEILPQAFLNKSVTNELRFGVGGGEEQFLRDERTLESLILKHDEVQTKYENNIFEYLKFISNEYFKENEKLKPNEVVNDFLVSKWNEILSSYRVIEFTDFSSKNKKTPEFSDYKANSPVVNKSTSITSPSVSNIITGKQINEWDINNFTIAYLYKKFGVIDKENTQVDIIKGQADLNRLTFKSNNPFVVVSDYNNYSTKGIKPLTITDTYLRTKNEGEINGFLYQKQNVNTVEIENFTYKKLTASLLGSSSTDKTEISLDDKISAYESQVKEYEIFDKAISDVINKTLVIMGR